MTIERLTDLLAEEFERGLTPEEQLEKARLLQDNADWSEDDFQLAAAAAELALLGDGEDAEVPDALEARVLDQAKGFFSVDSGTEESGAAGTYPAARADSDETGRSVIPLPTATRESTTSSSASTKLWWSGWAVAAVALLAFGGTSLVGSGGEKLGDDGTIAASTQPDPCPEGAPPAEEPEPEPNLAQEREQLLAHSATVRWNWQNTEDALSGAVKGDVVWNAHEQSGYMHFSGLPKNHPEEAQYQLWIFDKERKEAHPVDGGVFDVVDGEVIVAIDPRIPVHEATLFAVTLEKPGGVVVSTRERLVVLASPG